MPTVFIVTVSGPEGFYEEFTHSEPFTPHDIAALVSAVADAGAVNPNKLAVSYTSRPAKIVKGVIH